MADEEKLPEEAFEVLMGRLPTDDERQRLAKVREALRVRSNDAIWEVMIALDYHLQLYRAVPATIAEETRKAVAELRGIVESGKRKQKAQPSSARGTPPVGSPAIGAAVAAAAVAYGAICLAAGYLMAGRARPPWGAPGPLGAVLAAPAGWLVFVLLLPLASKWVAAGWRAARSQEGFRVRAVGWAVLAGSVALIGAGLAALAKALRP